MSMSWRVVSPFESARQRREAMARLIATRGQQSGVDALTARLTEALARLGRGSQ